MNDPGTQTKVIMGVGVWPGQRRGGNWDNYNSINNKIFNKIIFKINK